MMKMRLRMGEEAGDDEEGASENERSDGGGDKDRSSHQFAAAPLKPQGTKAHGSFATKKPS